MRRRRPLSALGPIVPAGCVGEFQRQTVPGESPGTGPSRDAPQSRYGSGTLIGRSFAGRGGVGGPGRSAANRATVTWLAGALSVEVDGTIRTANMGPRATLDGVRYDASADELRVDVTTAHPSPAEAHTSLPVESAYDYRATFEFASALPRRVVVRHHGSVVVSASCRPPRGARRSEEVTARPRPRSEWTRTPRRRSR